jgi:diphthamide synthase (EF-2-diphthine--ammonia ligase)
MHKETGLDVCGENGEYHSLVTDGPLFHEAVQITHRSTRTEGRLMYLVIKKMK